MRDENRSAALFEITFGQRQCPVDLQTGAPQHVDQTVEA
jgi:hypothetical protein